MQYRHLLEICVRGYGLFLLIQVPFSLLSISSVFSMDTSQFIKNPAIYKFSAIASPIIHIAVALLLIRYAGIMTKLATHNFTATPITDTNEIHLSSNQAKLSFCIIIIGLYFFAQSSTKIFSKIMSLPITSLNIYWGDVIVVYGFVFSLSLVFIFKSDIIATFIYKKTNNNC